MRLAGLLVLLSLSCRAQILGPILASPSVPGVTAITLDKSCTGSAAAASVATCSMSSVTAGDTIGCVGFKNNNFDPGNLYFNDPTNGYYSSVYGYAHPTSANLWVGAAIFENSAAGTITPQVWNWESAGMGISCWAWKNTPTGGTLDGGGTNLTRSATAANPTSGTAAAPTNANSVVMCQLVRATAATTSNSGAWLPSGTLTGVTQTLAQYTQYQIQTTANTTNCDMTSASAAFRDTQFTLINGASTGGYRGLTGMYGVPATAQTNSASASLTILNTISGAGAGALTPFQAAGGSAWTLMSGSAVTWDTSVAPLGSLELLANQQAHTVGDAATSIHFPAANVTTAYNYAPEGFANQGTGVWVGSFFRINTGATSGQGCDVMGVFGSVVDNSITVQAKYDSTTKIGFDLEAQDSSTSTTYNPGAVLGQDYFIIVHVAGVNEANNEIYVLGESTPGTLPWTVLGHGSKAVVTTAVATTTGTITGGSTALTVVSGTGLAIGQSVAMAGVLAGTTLASGSGLSWVLSQPAASTQAGVTANFWAAAGGPYNFAFGKYSSCSLNSADTWMSGFIYDPYGALLPLIAAGSLQL